MSELTRRKTCRLCDSRDLTRVLSLEPTPPANAFVPKSKLNRVQKRFPLELFLCGVCGHIQLLDIVDPKILFEDYVYVSGTSRVFVEHFKRYAADMMSSFRFPKGSLVVDIGSNDGTFLKFFKKAGYKTLGIDPAKKIAERASAEGIQTLEGFFTPSLAHKIKLRHGKARLVSANNVFAHSDDLAGMVKGVKTLLHPEGVFCFEVSYFADVFEKNLFDTIYHEHLSYHTLKPLMIFFEKQGMRLIAAERAETHGGSLRGIVTFADASTKGLKNDQTKSLLAHEKSLKLDRPGTFKIFEYKIKKAGKDLAAVLKSLRRNKKRIAGFGAPAKATTLMYQYALDKKTLEFIVDENPLKQGLYTPGFHIPVVPSSWISDKRPDILLILAWNFADSIIKNHRVFRRAGGHFIVPLPELKIL